MMLLGWNFIRHKTNGRNVSHSCVCPVPIGAPRVFGVWWLWAGVQIHIVHKVRVIIFHRATATQRKSYVSMFVCKIFAKGSTRVSDAAAIAKFHSVLVYLRKWPWKGVQGACVLVRTLQPPTFQVQAKWNYIFGTIWKSISSAASILSLPLSTWLPQCLNDPGSSRGADTSQNE